MSGLSSTTPEQRLYGSLILGAVALIVFIFRKPIAGALTQRPWTAERLMRIAFWLMVLFIILATILVFHDRGGMSVNLIQRIQ